MKKLALIMLGALVSFNTLAAAGWSGISTITSIYAIDDERVLIKLSSFTNHGECDTNGNGDVIINSITHKNWFAMVLSAYAASKPVEFYVADSCTPIWVNTSYANVGHMRLK